MAALSRERAISTVVGSSHLKRLLHAEDKNPWLAVLAAYALTLAEEESRRPNADPAATPSDPVLKQDILAFLRQTLGSHPDVRALCLAPDAPASNPFAYPPLVRIGLQRVEQHATRFADTIPLDSLTERMLTKQITSSLWSIWREPIPVTREAAERDAAPVATRRVRAGGGVPLASLGASAPVYRAAQPSRSRATATTQLRQALYDLPVIKAAQQMIGSTDWGVEKIVVNSREAAGKLLSEIEPQALSAAASIPLGRAEQGLTKLKATVDGSASASAKAGPAERAILQYALRQGAQGGGPQSDATTPSRSGAVPDGNSLEGAVSALRNASAQLSRLSPDLVSDPLLATRANSIAARLAAIADSLLGQADLIVLTDVNGRFLYANGAFTLLVTPPAGEKLAGMCRSWCDWLSTLPLGRSTGLTSPADSTNRLWVVRRTAVEDETTHQTTAFVNILEDEKRSAWSDATFEELAHVVSSITLHASFVQYGSSQKVTASLEKLEALATKLESLVAPAVKQK
jgi:PAS domain-containing protein